MAAAGRLGVLGTLVWDRIHHPSHAGEEVEDWGGIAYTLSALAAALPAGWEIVPLVKVGEDLAGRARDLLDSLPGVRAEGVRVVPEPNNRVQLDYTGPHRRRERQSGGVPPWSHAELLPLLPRLDALQVNFISGQEIALGEMRRVRADFPGPLYADLHSLLLEPPHGGARRPRAVARFEDWLRCFDAVQLNQEELATQAGGAEPWSFAARALAPAVRLALVTRGAEGARWLAAEGLPPQPRAWRRAAEPAPPGGSLREAPAPPPARGDPTGCGDVWGGVLFARLLAGDGFAEALDAAGRAAARNAERRGTAGLADDLARTLAAPPA